MSKIYGRPFYTKYNYNLHALEIYNSKLELMFFGGFIEMLELISLL
jgi:hypothetical protein